MKFFVTVATMIGLATGSSVMAQSVQQGFHAQTVQVCLDSYQEANRMVEVVTTQKLLFTGIGTVTLLVDNSIELRTPAMISFYVDQDTGEFSILKTFDDGVTCIVTEGAGFEPYVD